MTRSKLLTPIVAFILTMSAIAGVWMLVGRADSSSEAQLRISSLKLSLADLQSAPFSADPRAGGSPAATLARIAADELSISTGLTPRLQAGVPPSLLSAGRAGLARVEPIIARIYRIAVQKGGLPGAGALVPRLQGVMIVRSAALSAALGKISRTDAANARNARTQTELGAAAAMLLLLIAFAYYYVRSVAAREAVDRLARVRNVEARTDALTHLGNRRALDSDLARATAEPPGDRERLLVMFDLDGFKQYNDTFGHAAGDSLLQRLGDRLGATVSHLGSAYRMGGDEFCVLAEIGPDAAERLLDDTIAALRESGENWRVGCSLGAVWMPSEAATENEALKLADERMYANKASRSSASEQVTDALLQVVTEQDASLDEHVERVSELCGTIAQALGLPEGEVSRIRLAARLHDIGKTAIPAAILDKPGPLDEREWTFMRRHPLIGERIVLAAPALADTAKLIRSSHERIDGHGYPDGLAGEEIPLGSRIIAVCDAFDAMTSTRPYRPTVSVDAALAELNRHAGTQFDASIVRAFAAATSLHHGSADEPHPNAASA